MNLNLRLRSIFIVTSKTLAQSFVLLEMIAYMSFDAKWCADAMVDTALEASLRIGYFGSCDGYGLLKEAKNV